MIQNLASECIKSEMLSNRVPYKKHAEVLDHTTSACFSYPYLCVNCIALLRLAKHDRPQAQRTHSGRYRGIQELPVRTEPVSVDSRSLSERPSPVLPVDRGESLLSEHCAEREGSQIEEGVSEITAFRGAGNMSRQQCTKHSRIVVGEQDRFANAGFRICVEIESE